MEERTRDHVLQDFNVEEEDLNAALESTLLINDGIIQSILRQDNSY
jgi:hypothetical protein